MSRAVFGKRLRELFSTELAFSGRLATNCLNQDVWHEAPIQDLPQAWMALTAIGGDFRCCQSFVGPKIRPAAPAIDLVTAVRQAVGALFWFVESQPTAWMSRTGSEPVTTFGPDHELADEQGGSVNLERIFELFRSGVAELSPILKTILAPDTYAEIQRVATLDERNLWLREFPLGAGLFLISRRPITISRLESRPLDSGPCSSLPWQDLFFLSPARQFFIS